MSSYIRTKSLSIVLAAKGILASCSSDSNGTNTTSTSSSNAECASSCIETFVAENYPASVCLDNQDLRCLCTKSNPTGLTIGEALLQCVLASCNGVSTEELGRLYSICAGIDGALPQTHATLTATVEATSMSTDTSFMSVTDPLPPATSTLPPSIPNPFSTEFASSIVVASSTSLLPSSPDDTTFVTSPTSTASSSRSSGGTHTTPDPQTSPSPTAVADSSARQNLSNGAVAGIVVGGVATAFAVFGLLYLCCCMRKRQKSKRDSDEWLSDSNRPKDRRHSALSFFFRPTPADPPARSQPPYIPPAGGNQRRSFWRKSIRPEEIGVAVSPQMSQQESPANSAHSHASASALLPDKPNWNASNSTRPAQAAGAGTDSSRRKESIESTGTVFAEDLEGLGLSGSSSEAHPNHGNLPPPPRFNLRPLQPRRPPRLVLTQSGRGLPSDPRAQMYAMERQQRATGYAAQPRIPLTPIYDNGNATAPWNAWTSSAPQARPQLPPGPLRDPRVQLAPPVEKSRHGSSVYDSNASLPPSEPRGRESFNVQPLSSQPSQRTSFQPMPRHSTVPNPAVRSSTASSTTSFEDDDDYNYQSSSTAPFASQTISAAPARPTIRHISHQSRPITLSPVIESPIQNRIHPQPPRYVAYPPIPRPSSIARQAERLPLPRAGRYLDTRGPAPPHTPNASTKGATDNRVPSSLNVGPPSSDGRALGSNTNAGDTSTRGDARSPSPSETSSALLARRRGARAAGDLKIDEEGLKKKRKEAEGWKVIGTKPSNLPGQRSQEQKRAQRVDYSGEGWGDEKENQNATSEPQNERGRWNVTPTRGKDGDLVLRVG